MGKRYYTTEGAIEAIREILDGHVPGTWKSGWKMRDFLVESAKDIEEAIGDSMSHPT